MYVISDMFRPQLFGHLQGEIFRNQAAYSILVSGRLLIYIHNNHYCTSMLKTYMLKLLLVLQLVLYKIAVKVVKICFQTSCFQHVRRTLIVTKLYVSQVATLYRGLILRL
jgi:hypothetical protein